MSEETNTFSAKSNPPERCNSKYATKYILLRDALASTSLVLSKPRLAAKSSEIKVLKGSMWEEANVKMTPSPTFTTLGAIKGKLLPGTTVGQSSASIKHQFTSLEFEDIQLQCPLSYLSEVTEEDCRVLLAIPAAEERLRVHCDEERMRTSKLIKIDSEVTVVKRNLPACCGVVRFKGHVHGRQGIWFGIEITDANMMGQGDCDGSINGTRLFSCAPKNGVFANIANINLIPPRRPPRKPRKAPAPAVPIELDDSTTASQMTGTELSDNTSSVEDNTTIQVNDRVIWLCHHGYERATVKWIGTVAIDGKTNKELLAGIEFDNPVGKGTGIYKGRKLFECRKGHASLVPLDGLLRDADSDAASDTVLLNSDYELEASYESHLNHIPLSPPYDIDAQIVNYNNNTYCKPLKLESAADKSFPVSPSYIRRTSGRYANNAFPVPHSKSSEVSHFSNGTLIPKRSYSELENGGHTDTAIPIEVNAIMSKDEMDSQIRACNHRSHITSESSISFRDDAHLATNSRHWHDPVHCGSSGPELSPSSSAHENHFEHLSADQSNSVSDRDTDGEWEDMSSSAEESLHITVEGEHLSEPIINPPPAYSDQSSADPIPRNGNLQLPAVVITSGSAVGSMQDINDVPYPDELHNSVGYQVSSVVASNAEELSISSDKAAASVAGSETVQSIEVASYTSDASIEHPPTDVCQSMIGRNRGIEGSAGSSCADSCLYILFASSHSYKEALSRLREIDDITNYDEIQLVLANDIVKPLREDGLVSCLWVEKLRRLLDDISIGKELMTEKEAEKFLKVMLEHVFRVPPYIQLSCGRNCHILSLCSEKDARRAFPTTQKLLEMTCTRGKAKFLQVPSLLILQMPHYSPDSQPYPIFPCLELHLADLLQHAVRLCHMCGEQAMFECPECFTNEGELQRSTFCEMCSRTIHKHSKREGHLPVQLEVPQLESSSASAATRLQLFAVLCKKESHRYVSICKLALEGGLWVHFDSLAYVEGKSYVPEVTRLTDVEEWLSTDGYDRISRNLYGVPPHIQNLVRDSCICFYRHASD